MSNTFKVKVGTWHEEGERVIDHTSYAADKIIKETIPGDYPVYLTFDYGFAYARDISVAIPSNTVESHYYNGFGGNNFSCNHNSDLGPSTHYKRPYAYELPTYVENGRITLDKWAESFLKGPHDFDHGFTVKELVARSDIKS